LNARELAVDFCKYRGEDFKKIGFYAKIFKNLIEVHGEDYITFVYNKIKKDAENFYSPRYLQYHINNIRIKADYERWKQKEFQKIVNIKRMVKEKQEKKNTRYKQTSQHFFETDLSRFKE